MAHGGSTDGLAGRPAFDRDGERIGTLEDLYLDRATGEPALALVSNGLRPGTGAERRLVPLAGARESEGSVTLDFALEQISAAPPTAGEEELTPAYEREVYAHYGVEPPAPPPPQPAPVADHEAMTVSEEQLVVDKVHVPTERVRVAKHVVTEEVTVTVTLRREELRIEREPVTQPEAVELAPGTSPGESQTEFLLLAEEPVVSTRVVPVERVRLGKDAVVEERQVNGEVRKERIDVEREAGA